MISRAFRPAAIWPSGVATVSSRPGAHEKAHCGGAERAWGLIYKWLRRAELLITSAWIAGVTWAREECLKALSHELSKGLHAVGFGTIEIPVVQARELAV